MRIVPTIALIGGAASMLAITGCGSSDGGGGGGGGGSSGSSTVNTLFYTGSGDELVSDQDTNTDYVGAVTRATGFFSSDDYLRVKTTLMSRLYLTSSTGVLRFDFNTADGVSGSDLTADAATRSYIGTYTWAESSGPLNGYTITADIALKPTNGRIELEMTATASDGTTDKTGTAHLVYHNPFVEILNGSGYYDALVKSSDPRYNYGCSEWETDNGDSTLVVWHDMYGWNDDFAPVCYVEGTTITGAAYFTYASDTTESLWGSMVVKIDAYGRALSGTVVHDSLTTGKSTTFTQATMLSEELGAAMNPSPDEDMDLTPTSVSGSILSTYYTTGTTVSAGFSRSNNLDDWHWININLPSSGTGLEEFENGTGWNGVGAYPGYDLASKIWYGSVYDRLESGALLDDDGNQLEVKFSVSTDTTGLSTGGTLSLLHINPTTGAIVSTEKMAFTLAALAAVP